MKIEPGQKALITGASRGLGVEIARRFAASGVDLVLAARSVDALEQVSADIRGAFKINVMVHPVDMANETSVVALAQAAGAVDYLVNNAGVEGAGAYSDRPLDDITTTIAINLTGPMVLSRVLLPGMVARGQGHIVNIASLAGVMPVAFNEPYSATKAGLIAFTQSLRLTARASGWPVSASAVCPGFVDGAGMFEDLKGKHDVAEENLGTVDQSEISNAVSRAIEQDLAIVLAASGVTHEFAAYSILDPMGFEVAMLASPATEMFRQLSTSNFQ